MSYDIQGVQKKMSRSFCLISLATNMLEGWDIFHLKSGIHSSLWSTKKICTISGSWDISKSKWDIRFRKTYTGQTCVVKFDVCIISLATNMLEDWDIFCLKGGIHSSVWRTKTYLYNIRVPRYKQIKMWYQISNFLNIGQSSVLKSEVLYCFTYILIP